MELVSLLMQILLWPLCLSIVGLILLQGGAGDLSSAFGGGGMLDSTLGVGASRKMAKVTGWMAGIFFVFVIVLSIPHKGGLGGVTPKPAVSGATSGVGATSGAPETHTTTGAVIVPSTSAPRIDAAITAPSTSAPVLAKPEPVVPPTAPAAPAVEAAKAIEAAAPAAPAVPAAPVVEAPAAPAVPAAPAAEVKPEDAKPAAPAIPAVPAKPAN